MKQAWEMEREFRDAAVPYDRRTNPSNWYQSETVFPQGDDLIRKFWFSNVPGSFAPEIPYQEMAQAWSNQGYDVREAEKLLPEGIALSKTEDMDALRVITARILKALNNAPKDLNHPYHQFEHPMSWEAVLKSLPLEANAFKKQAPIPDDFEQRIYQSWLGQLAGGSFGTAIEGYTGQQIANVYGKIDGYLSPPETTNDDVVYELVFLDVFEKMGASITSEAIAEEWIRQIPFGWSAEWIALRNLNMGIFPPESGSFLNFYSDWIGVQMRGMICGLLSPHDPLEAARLAFIDGVVSHANNGVYGGMFAAVATSLAFHLTDPRQLIKETLNFIPHKSEYALKYRLILDILQAEPNPTTAWEKIDPAFKRYNWIHAYPNLAADLFSLWYGESDFGKSMQLLSLAGHDVDCNAGLVGSVLGVMKPVPRNWAEPLGDLLETYLKGKEKLSIRELAARTARAALKS